MKSHIDVEDYRVFFGMEGYPASGSSCIHDGSMFYMTVLQASDAAGGVSAHLTSSTDDGKTWETPLPIGPALANPGEEFQGISLAHVLADGTLFAVGSHLPKGYKPSSGGHGLYRPGEILLGRRPPNQADFSWDRIPSGAFLDEQFIAPALRLDSGRIICTLWGSARRNENWQCGVLLSDDDGRSFRYRQVGYDPDLGIRKNAEVVAGFNEQTLFAVSDDTIVSIIRGRDHLGEISGASPRSSECLFFRSLSEDGGESWSSPEPTNLPGTGAPSTGMVLPDGSLILPARVPSLWSRHAGHSLCGLHLARSYDMGITWETELLLHSDPSGEPYDNYYNAMNGTFVKLGDRLHLYVFGHFRKSSPEADRANALLLRVRD